jgi:hypothetical protein
MPAARTICVVAAAGDDVWPAQSAGTSTITKVRSTALNTVTYLMRYESPLNTRNSLRLSSTVWSTVVSSERYRLSVIDADPLYRRVDGRVSMTTPSLRRKRITASEVE